jgi:hypothetical protein
MVHQGISRRVLKALRTTMVIEPSIFVEGDLTRAAFTLGV